MKKITLICSLLFLFISCQQRQEMTDLDIYEFLEICYEDYYKNYEVNLLEELDNFEKQLLAEGHLQDTTGSSYKDLLKQLSENKYFTPPLTTQHFNEIVLLKNPLNIVKCTENSFGVDSTLVSQTHFSIVSQRIANYMSQNEEVSIQYFFDTYRKQLTRAQLKMPYIRPTILIMLYRWYYQSEIHQNHGEKEAL